MEKGRAELLRFPLGPLPLRHVPVAAWIASGVLLALAVGAALAPIGGVARVAACAGLLAAAVVPVVLFRGSRRGEARGWVAVDDLGIVRTDRHGSTRLARWTEPFGLSVLASRGRGRFLLAFTTPAQTRLVRVHTRRDGDAELTTLVERAATVVEGDVPGGPADDDAALAASDAEHLLRTVAERAPAALQRIYLSDPHGAPIVLDGSALRLGSFHVDLSAPLEWRGFMFHESGGRVTALYQATWVRQAEGEAVLVATVPGDGSWAKELDHPPAREHRLAVDGLFMDPLRRALDRAPRVKRAPKPPSRQGLGEGQRTNT